MSLPFLLAALSVTALAAGVVYTDSTRRGLARRTRFRWTGSVALVSLTCFAGAFTFETALARVALAATGRPVVVTSPRELLTWLTLVGLFVSAVAVLGYGFGSRVGPFAARASVR